MPRGGVRVGAGRPRKSQVVLDVGYHGTPQSFLQALMAGPKASMKLRIYAAKALLSAELRLHNY